MGVAGQTSPSLYLVILEGPKLLQKKRITFMCCLNSFATSSSSKAKVAEQVEGWVGFFFKSFTFPANTPEGTGLVCVVPAHTK